MCTAVFSAAMAAAYYWPFAHAGDAAALRGFESIDTRGLDGVLDTVLRVCDPAPFALIAVVLVVAVARYKSPRHALAVWVLLVGANASSQLLKPLLAHHRDTSLWHIRQINPAAYPSGHSTAAMSLALALVLGAPRAYRPLAAVIGGVFAVAISFFALILGWHYPSDIVGGFLLATIWSLVLLAGLRFAAVRWPAHGGMRLAARRAIALPLARTLAWAVAIGCVAAIVLAATRADRLVSYVDRHHALVFVATVIALSAAGLLGGVTVLTGRRR